MDLQKSSIENIISLLTALSLGLLGAIVLVLTLIGLGYIFLLWHRNKNREKESLESVLLQISLPRENEIKIDAAEQMFASLASIRKGGRFSFLKMQPSISFEIVGFTGDMRFYVHASKTLRDLVEKQINGTYPDAEIIVVDEKTTRLLIENPKKLHIIINHNLHSKVILDKNNLSEFAKMTKNVKIIRSVELAAVSYERGLLDKYVPNIDNARQILLQSVLWGFKLNGCDNILFSR